MPLTYVERYSLVVAPLFLQRIEVALMKFAIYINNGGDDANPAVSVPAIRAWAKNMIFSPSDRAAAVTSFRWPVLENVCVSKALTGSGDTLDSAATDAEITGEIDTQVRAAFPVAA